MDSNNKDRPYMHLSDVKLAEMLAVAELALTKDFIKNKRREDFNLVRNRVIEEILFRYHNSDY